MPTKNAVKGTLRAGAAEVDITPALGIQLGGDIGRPRPVEVVADPLYAKALVLEAGGRKLCIISMDLCAVTEEWSEAIRRAAAERYGIDHDAIMVHPVQNHAAPTVGNHMIQGDSPWVTPDLDWLRGGDDRYNAMAVDGILKAVGQANASLQPAQIGSRSGIEARVAFNRRYVMRDGTVKTHPPKGSTDILHVEGPMDPEVGVTCINAPSAKNLALLLHHTCHPVHGFGRRYVTAGWPGAWADGIRQEFGKDCVPLVLNGCCGNVHHDNPLDARQVDDPRQIGRILTEDVRELMRTVRTESNVVLDYRVRRFKLPIRAFNPKELQAARKLLKEHPRPTMRTDSPGAITWDWCYAVCLLDLYSRHRTSRECDYEVQVLRVGDNAYVALGGEPFVEGQLQIKLQSPVRYTYVAHMCHVYIGYIPTKQALERKGYEARMGNWSKLAPEALDIIVAEAGKLLREVFPDKVTD